VTQTCKFTHTSDYVCYKQHLWPSCRRLVSMWRKFTNE